MAEQIKIEDIISEKLTGERQKDALNFVALMKTNGISFKQIGSGNSVRWTPTYKSKSVGRIQVSTEYGLGFWCSFNELKDYDSVDDDFKKVIWDYVVICPQSGCKPPYCKNSKVPYKIFQKEYESTCHAPLAFFNPDAKTLEIIEKLILLYKQLRNVQRTE